MIKKILLVILKIILAFFSTWEVFAIIANFGCPSCDWKNSLCSRCDTLINSNLYLAILLILFLLTLFYIAYSLIFYLIKKIWQEFSKK
ncbi:MAG TPA: hypothetical protein P5232_04415 [Candidatus Moranbacteria bacterium]|nr:hypothetical protein [Candidatus Moranbacteria bacterium]